MRWSLVLCLLIASAALAKPRPKRTLGYIKNLITSKLFGTNTVVISRPILAKNESQQFFKIPGFDDILIKVSRNENKTQPNEEEEKHEVKPAKPVDPVMVKPDVAIIGSYLGTNTEKETLLAIEMVKNLLKSGILNELRDNSMQDLVVPIIPQSPYLDYIDEQNVPVQPLHVFADEQGHVFTQMRGMQQVQVGNPTAIPVYPDYTHLYVSPEVEPAPFLSKYFYKQKGNHADMNYNSYYNKDVIVTRTEKEPPVSQSIKLRIAEVANIDAKPYIIRNAFNSGTAVSEKVQEPEILPYLSKRIGKPSRNGAVESAYTRSNVTGGQNPLLLSESLPVDNVVSPCRNNLQKVIRCKVKSAGKVCPHNKVQVNINQDQHIASNIPSEPKPSQVVVVNKQHNANKVETNANRLAAVNEFLKMHSVNGQLVSQYTYNQMNHHSKDNYTEVKVGASSKLTKDVSLETKGNNFDKNFVFVPPKDVDLPVLSVLSLNNQDGNHGKNDDKNAFTSKVSSNEVKHFVPSAPNQKSNEEPKDSNYFKSNPIVVAEHFDKENGEKRSNTDNVKTNEDVVAEKDENSKRGDIPNSSF